MCRDPISLHYKNERSQHLSKLMVEQCLRVKLSNKPTEKNVRTSGGILFAQSSAERKVHWRGKLSLQTYSKYF
jgi:hypothetical protein